MDGRTESRVRKSRAPREGPPVPGWAGIGLRAEHERAFVETRPAVAWIEAHSENYFGGGGKPLAALLRARESYPVSLHGVGLGLGNADPLEFEHLRRLKELVALTEPFLVSEHLSWNAHEGRHFNDLLPLPCTREAVHHLAGRIQALQEFIGREVLVENASSYLEFAEREMSEWEFVAEVVREAGCKLLLDINNVYVNACNHGHDPARFIDSIAPGRVAEFHLAGHSRRRVAGGATLLIDTHDAPVCDEVWALYRYALRAIGPRPTLIEWDARLPALDVLVGEARTADRMTEQAHARSA